MSKIEVKEVENLRGKILYTAVYISQYHYGSTGRHWARVLGNPKMAWKYGKIYIDRLGAHVRRTEALEGTWIYGPGDPSDRDECPGAMFLSSNHELSDIAACDRISNQALGRDLMEALKRCYDWTEVVFYFDKSSFDSLPGKVAFPK